MTLKRSETERSEGLCSFAGKPALLEYTHRKKGNMKDEQYELMIKRAKRLMASAEDPAASETNAAIAWERAQKTMNEYAIEDWRLHRQDRMNDPIVKRKVRLHTDPMNQQKALLARVVARGNRADVYNTVRKAGNGRTVVESITFCGTQRDCRHAELIWTSMEAYRGSHWRGAARQNGIKPDGTWRNGYYLGFLFRISDRYEKLGPKREGSSTSAGAMNELARVRAEQVDAFMKGLDLREPELPEMNKYTS